MSGTTFSDQSITRSRLRVRRAHAADHATILELTGALELTYPAMDLPCFWVAELDGVTVGVAELKDLESCSLLSCVGVREELQGRGIGRELVDRVVREALHPVYLYTLVPDFFRKAGFRDPSALPPDLPPRAIYGCIGCDPSRCLCLMRPREDT
jgi:N-acetylglutamate synthase-like GNAT family acetyltransferase